MSVEFKFSILALCIPACFINSAFCQTSNKFESERIEDNSFLIEEAYNQESGVIQHISTFQYTKENNWLYTFTEELPVSGQKHQLSATIPVLNNGATGIGDIAINYRYQAVFRSRIAFSPRFSVLLPTGNYEKGLGSSAIGYQVNMPFSYLLSPKIVTHYNAGVTITPRAKNLDGSKADITTFNYGLSMIFLFRSNFNFMLEVAGNTTSISGSNLANIENNTLVISPGMRYAINLKSGLQIVPGVAYPIGVGPIKGKNSLFTYLSFEHNVRKK
jgi:hypothetical protein